MTALSHIVNLCVHILNWLPCRMNPHSHTHILDLQTFVASNRELTFTYGAEAQPIAAVVIGMLDFHSPFLRLYELTFSNFYFHYSLALSLLARVVRRP